MYVITGATGNTGKRIAHTLLDAGRQVRVIGRSAERMQEFADKGAEVFVGELMDPVSMERAFAGASAAYLLIPPKVDAEDFRGYQNAVIDSLVPALEKSPVTHIMTLSSVGADVPDGNGPVGGLYDLEQRLNQLTGVNILHLRPGYFMENTFGLIGPIKAMGIAGTPIAPDAKVPMIASQDIAAYAAKRLLALDFTGCTHQELQGQRDVTYSEVTKIYGAKIGKPDLQYVQFPADQALQAMMQMGLSKSISQTFIELGEGLKNGRVSFKEPRSAENSTPTSLEEFANVWAAVYNA